MTEQTTARPRSEDPPAALDAVQRAVFGPVPVEGTRHEALMDLAYRAAEAGQNNDWILNVLNVACDLWDKYPRTYERWTALLNMLRRARATYPNDLGGGTPGAGWRPGGTR
jgi:hypothetical protein